MLTNTENLSENLTIEQCITTSASKLSEVGIVNARFEAMILLAFVLDKNRAFLYSHNDLVLNSNDLKRYQSLFKRRLKHEPIAYILGEKEFYGLTFKVNQHTLIPRPETEMLVDTAIDFCQKWETSSLKSVKILDLGTGSGAIAIALSVELSRLNIAHEIYALDKSKDALELAQVNANLIISEKNEKSVAVNKANITFLTSDWFSALDLTQHKNLFDLIISNPPYICSEDQHLQAKELTYEPITALSSGLDGLMDLRHIIQTAPNFLAENGMLLLEHGYNQASAVATILQTNNYHHIHQQNDLNANQRMSLGYRGNLVI